MTREGELLLGAHMSVAGGLHLAVERGAALGCTAVQIFTKNANRWRERDVGGEELDLYRRSREGHPSVRAVVAHAGYLINLASPDGALREKSVIALVREVERCARLGLAGVIIHPGSHGGRGEEEGLGRAAASLGRVIERTPWAAVAILLENTAGQGNALGWRFEHLGSLLGAAGGRARMGVCLDTAHAFAAGYDLRTAAACRRTLAELDRAVGLERLGAIHLNDSRKGLGSRVDRHEHIGRGAIGLEGFKFVMRREEFRGLPKILETPKTDGGLQMDPVNLEMLRRLAG